MVERNGGGRGIRTPKGLAARWISSPLPYQLRLALRVSNILFYYHYLSPDWARSRQDHLLTSGHASITTPRSGSFERMVGTGADGFRNGDAESVRGLQVDH